MCDRRGNGSSTVVDDDVTNRNPLSLGTGVVDRDHSQFVNTVGERARVGTERSLIRVDGLAKCPVHIQFEARDARREPRAAQRRTGSQRERAAHGLPFRRASGELDSRQIGIRLREHVAEKLRHVGDHDRVCIGFGQRESIVDRGEDGCGWKACCDGERLFDGAARRSGSGS